MAVEFTFPNGTTLPAGGFLVVAPNPAALQAKFGATALGPWSDRLANEGEAIVLKNAAGGVEDEVTYRLGFPWPTVGDTPGYSIELINPALDNSLGGNWRPHAPQGPLPPGERPRLPAWVAPRPPPSPKTTMASHPTRSVQGGEWEARQPLPRTPGFARFGAHEHIPSHEGLVLQNPVPGARMPARVAVEQK